jgi:hypothetical protein
LYKQKGLFSKMENKEVLSGAGYGLMAAEENVGKSVGG